MSDRVLRPPFTVTLASDAGLTVFKESNYTVASETAHAFFEDSKADKVYVQVRDAEKEVWTAERGLVKEPVDGK